MKISSQPLMSPMPSPDQPLELKKGEVHNATIKERLSQDEAVLLIRGKEVRATFAGKVPQDDRVTVQITDTDVQEQRIQVQTVATTSSKGSTTTQEADLGQVLRNLGASTNTSPELRQALQLLLDKGVPITKEALQELRHFLETAQGSIRDKLQAIHALVNKGLEVTQRHLLAVHEALHGRPLHDALSVIKQDLAPHAADKQAGAPNVEGLLAQIREQLVNQFGERGVAQARPQLANQLLKEAIRHVQRQANFGQAVEQIREQLLMKQPLPAEMGQQVEKGIEQANQLLQQGRELAARQQMMQTLTRVQENLSRTEAASQQGGGLLEQIQHQPYIEDERTQGTVPFSTKDMVVTTVTKKLAQATLDFKDLQREVSKSLDHIARLIQQFQRAATPQVKSMLESTIAKLDKAILKSDLMLLTDMKTEKQLMNASSQLAEAKRLLGKGDHQAAQRMVQDVQTMLDKINFRPAETKVQHMLSNELKQTEGARLESTRPSPQLLNQFSEITRSLALKAEESSPRQLFELVRSLGLNHEHDVVQRLAMGQEQDRSNAQQGNLKGLLLQLMRGEAEGKFQQQAEQLLHNLTGQQLLSKGETSNNMQQVFFNLPFTAQEKESTLKVFINSRNGGQKIDWENCNLYFLFETPKLGQVGILLTAIERNLSITIRNNQLFFKEKMEPIVQKYKQHLQEIGYTISGVHFSKLEEPKEESQVSQGIERETQPSQPATAAISPLKEKGFDLKI